MSDAIGSFATAVTIGSGTANPVLATIPANAAGGTGYRLRIVSSAPASVGPARGFDITINPKLNSAGTVVGPVAPCVGAANLRYSVSSVSGATSYNWIVPAGWVITAGQGTTSITVTASGSAGNIAVTASDLCQSATASRLAVNPTTVQVAAAVTSPSIMKGSSTFLSATGADTYIWAPATGLSSTSTANPVATPDATITYTVTGTKNGCTSRAQVTVTVKEPGQPSDWVWVNQGENTFTIEANAVATDGAGNAIVTGYFYGTHKLGAYTISSPSYREIFIAKYDASGNVVWAKQAGSNRDDESRAIATDADGNIYITGYFGSSYSYDPAGAVTFGNITVTSTNENRDIFIAKYSPDGEIVWAKRAGGTGNDEGAAITADARGNLYTTGYFQNTADFGSETIRKDGGIGTGAFIVKQDSNGNVIWVKQAEGIATGIAVDIEGNCFITGSHRRVDYEDVDIFISKHDAYGSEIWRKQAGGGKK